MKQVAKRILIDLILGVLGLALGTLIFALWHPFIKNLIRTKGIGYSTLVQIAHFNTTEYVIAVFLGIGVARIRRGRTWLLDAAIVASVYVLVPYLADAGLLVSVFTRGPWDPRLILHGFMHSSLSAPIVLFCAMLASPRERYSEQQCQKCGYNLTGNTTGVCPECGTDLVTL